MIQENALLAQERLDTNDTILVSLSNVIINVYSVRL